MQTLVNEISTSETLEKMANAISRIEAAVNKRMARDAARKQIITEIDGCIANLEKLLNNSK